MKIEDKGWEYHATYDVHKKAKIGESYSGYFIKNNKIGNEGRKQRGSQTRFDKVL